MKDLALNAFFGSMMSTDTMKDEIQLVVSAEIHFYQTEETNITLLVFRLLGLNRLGKKMFRASIFLFFRKK